MRGWCNGVDDVNSHPRRQHPTNLLAILLSAPTSPTIAHQLIDLRILRVLLPSRHYLRSVRGLVDDFSGAMGEVPIEGLSDMPENNSRLCSTTQYDTQTNEEKTFISFQLSAFRGKKITYDVTRASMPKFTNQLRLWSDRAWRARDFPYLTSLIF